MKRTKLSLACCLALGTLVGGALQGCSSTNNTAAESSEAAYTGQYAEKMQQIDKVANQGPFKANWDSLAQYQIPEWYQDAKFGIFIHWGVYSVPAFNGEWYPRKMYQQPDVEFKHHQKHFGNQKKFGYKNFIPMFKAENFDADEWLKVIKNSGAKYIVPVAEHHDGFSMYDNSYSRWDSVEMGPKRDVIAELKEATSKVGLHFGLSSHRAENWWFFDGGRAFPSDVQDPEFRDLYGPAVNRKTSEEGLTPPNKEFLDDWLLRTVEIVDKYEPELIWFDWWMASEPFHEHVKKFAGYYYNTAKNGNWENMAAINYKEHHDMRSFPKTAGVLDIERGGLKDTRELFWQTDTSVSKNSWGYITNHKYKTAGSLIDDLIDIVSKNGSMLLNIGPKPDGTIPQEEIDMLAQMGDWLALNGEAIYSTRPWVKFGEGVTNVVDGAHANDAEKHRKDFTKNDVRFTKSKDDRTLYAVLMAWPGDNKEITIRSVNQQNYPFEVTKVSLLGSTSDIQFTQTKDGLKLKLPASSPSKFAQVIKIER